MLRGENNMIKSIWCEDVVVPAEMKANSRITYSFINAKDAEGNYTWAQVSSFVAVPNQEDVQRAVDSLLNQADDHHHIFIEGFDRNEDGSFEVVLGS